MSVLFARSGRCLPGQCEALWLPPWPRLWPALVQSSVWAVGSHGASRHDRCGRLGSVLELYMPALIAMVVMSCCCLWRWWWCWWWCCWCWWRRRWRRRLRMMMTMTMMMFMVMIQSSWSWSSLTHAQSQSLLSTGKGLGSTSCTTVGTMPSWCCCAGAASAFCVLCLSLACLGKACCPVNWIDHWTENLSSIWCLNEGHVLYMMYFKM